MAAFARAMNAGLQLANWINKERTKVHFPEFDNGERRRSCLDVRFSASPPNTGGNYKSIYLMDIHNTGAICMIAMSTAGSGDQV